MLLPGYMAKRVVARPESTPRSAAGNAGCDARSFELKTGAALAADGVKQF